MPLCAEATVIAKLNNANQAPTMPSPLRNHVPLPQQPADAIPRPKRSPPNTVADRETPHWATQ